MWPANWHQVEDPVLEELKTSELLNPTHLCCRWGKRQTKGETDFFFYNQRCTHKQHMVASVAGEGEKE